MGNRVTVAIGRARSFSPCRNSRQLLWLSRLAYSTANTCRRPSQSMPSAIKIARLSITPAFPHSFIARIHDHIRKSFLQRPTPELSQLPIQSSRDGADARGAKLVSAQLLGDGCHLPRRYSLHIHL